MACCGDKRFTNWEIAGGAKSFPIGFLSLLFLGCISALAVAGITLLSPMSASLRRQRGPFILAVRESLRRRTDELLDTPFLLDGRHRCRISSALYNSSDTLAGAVYRYFNLVLFGAVCVLLASGVLTALSFLP
jgi:hypothetical protein